MRSMLLCAFLVGCSGGPVPMPEEPVMVEYFPRSDVPTEPLESICHVVEWCNVECRQKGYVCAMVSCSGDDPFETCIPVRR